MTEKHYRVRKGYVFRAGKEILPEGTEFTATDEEVAGQTHLVELVTASVEQPAKHRAVMNAPVKKEEPSGSDDDRSSEEGIPESAAG